MCHVLYDYVIPSKTSGKASCRAHKATAMDAKVADEVEKHFRPAKGAICTPGGAKKWRRGGEEDRETVKAYESSHCDANNPHVWQACSQRP